MKTRLILTTLLSASSLYAVDWPQYRGPQGDGGTTEKIIAWPASGPKVLWKV